MGNANQIGATSGNRGGTPDRAVGSLGHLGYLTLVPHQATLLLLQIIPHGRHIKDLSVIFIFNKGVEVNKPPVFK